MPQPRGRGLARSPARRRTARRPSGRGRPKPRRAGSGAGSARHPRSRSRASPVPTTVAGPTRFNQTICPGAATPARWRAALSGPINAVGYRRDGPPPRVPGPAPPGRAGSRRPQRDRRRQNERGVRTHRPLPFPAAQPGRRLPSSRNASSRRSARCSANTATRQRTGGPWRGRQTASPWCVAHVRQIIFKY
jgi:hypothetical protein